MDCSEPFSPCKGLSAVSFVNGCWLVNTVSLTTLRQTHSFFCNHKAGLFWTQGRSKIWFHYNRSVRGFFNDKMGKVMFIDGTKTGSLSSPLLHPASSVPRDSAILCLQFDSSSPRSILDTYRELLSVRSA